MDKNIITRDDVLEMLGVSITALKNWSGKCEAHSRYLPVYSFPVSGEQPVYLWADVEAFLFRPENDKYLVRFKGWLQYQTIQMEMRALNEYRRLKPLLEEYLGIPLHSPPKQSSYHAH